MILSALDELRESAKDAKGDLRGMRRKIAGALREEQVDERTVAALFDEPLDRLGALRDELAKTIVAIHETLTPRQREQLSDLVESGTRWGYGYAC